MSEHIASIFGSAENFERLSEMHSQLLAAVATYTKRDRFADQQLTTFIPRRGLAARHNGLMIVGRAPNGWATPWTVADIADSSYCSKVVAAATEEFTSTECPMYWVEKPQDWNWKRSAFSRLMYQLTHHFLRDELIQSKRESDEAASTKTGWYSHLIWSNLYKVAPYNGGNPGNRLCTAQENACKNYFTSELEIWRPRRVVLVTGWNWAEPFVNQFVSTGVNAKRSHVEWAGWIELPESKSQLPLVVCKRPEFRRAADLVTAIDSAFQALGVPPPSAN
ncbi:hypothetical protein [Anatilimnocola floriformis]|uniref:hypothetical protein n=1 Tax=Anatilimnocola floriformis TaxID=2948575 RepID=UPI0020C34293|nr:hypothetical protein [Anatilimnocola floriformis]